MGKEYNMQEQIATVSKDMETVRKNQKKILQIIFLNQRTSN